MTRKFTFTILAMIFAILGSGAEAWGQAGNKYVKVTSAPTDWSGEYLLVYESSAIAGVAWTGVDAASCNVAVTISSGEIAEKPNDAVTITIATMTGGYSIKVNGGTNNGKYIKGTSGSNALGFDDNAQLNTISYDATNKGVLITSNTSVMRYNNTSNNYRFRYFKSSSYSSQKIVQLYKKEAGTPSHTLTLSATNGSISAVNGSTQITSGDNVEEGATLDITATADDWYKFSGWNVSGTGSTLGSTTANPTTFTMGTADATLTATFAACVVTVSSNDENWGIALYDDESHTISTAAEDGYRISSTEPYTIAPADAATLTAGDDDTFVVSGVKDQDVEITINFEALPSVAYTVFFDGNDHGTPASESIPEASAGVGVTLPNCTPNAGYQFVGWATSETATEAEYEAGAIYYPTANITLYAVYNEVYTINYMVNGANTNPQINVPMGTALVFPEVSAPDADHVFRGWVTEAIEGTTDTEPAYVNTTDLTATRNITYYAVFAEKEGGEESESLACPKGTISNNTMTFNTTNFVIVHAKGTSSNFAEYSPWRIYKNNTVTVSSNSKTISKLEMVTDGTYYGTWTTTAGTVNVATTSGGTTSVTGINAKEVTLENIGNAARWSNIAIYYDETSYSNFCTTVVTKILTSISLSGEYPTEFWKGDAFSHEGMIVTAHYNDGSTKDVTSSATFSTPNMTTVGEQTVTVTYDTKSTTYSITVKNIANTQETAYTVDEAKSLIDANPAELATTWVYVKGTISQVDSYNSTYHSITYWISEDGTTTNQFEVYSGKNLNNTDFASKDDVKVGDDVVVYGIIKKFNSTYEFDKNNYIVSHVKASTLSIDDITVEIGETITPEITTNVPDEYIIAYSVASEDVVKVDNGNLVTVAVGGPIEVTATLTAEGYKEATTTFEVEVIKALSSIAVKTAPTTTSYKAGDFFDPTGLVITATYSDATTEDVPYAENEDKFTFKPSLETALTTEDESVTITYADKASTTQEISVRELDTYDITWMANGEEHTTTQVTEGDAVVLPENPFAVGDMTFQGWINMENYYDAEIAPEYIVPDEIIPTEAMTFYAVYAKAGEGEPEETEFSFNTDNFTEITTSYTTTFTHTFPEATVEAYGVYKNDGIQMNSGKDTYIKNTTAMPGYMSKIVLTWKASGKNSVTMYANANSVASTSSDNLGKQSTTTTTHTINIDDAETKDYKYFYLDGTTVTGACVLTNFSIFYMKATTIYSNFCTTVKPIEEDKTISENTVWNGNITINEHTVTIGSGAVLTVNGALVNTNPANLVIKEGGQLIVNNKGVQATMEKNIDNTSKESNVNWYTISSPLAANTEFKNVTNLIPTTVTATDYDLYYLDEAIGMWINSRIYGDDDDYPVIANPDFTTIDKGRGYIYSNTTAADIAFAGEVNVADVECNLTIGAANGFNLIGNPFTQNIELTDVKSDGTTKLADGFYVLTNQNTWGTELTTEEIKPLQGFLVQATTAGDVTISKPTSAPSKGERSNEQSTNIEIIVSNSSYTDNAYAMFGEGIGLNKVNHRNAQAPMLYVPQDGEDFAIAFMDENTTVFPLNFKAMTTGNYSISLKPTDDINTLVLVDNMTGVETNMLLEGSYSFIGSPADNENRFTVKLAISHSNGQSDSEHFVYQSGNELVINGEGTLQIFDVLGRVVISEEVHGQTVNVGNLSTGAYIVRLTGESVMTQKIVVR